MIIPLTVYVIYMVIKFMSSTVILLDQLDMSSNSASQVSQSNDAPMPSVVPKLIDNKRKHLERKLSASKRDALFMEEAKKGKVFIARS